MRNVLELNIEGRYSESYEKQSMFGKEKKPKQNNNSENSEQTQIIRRFDFLVRKKKKNPTTKLTN